jgi:hypothetical protein
MFPDAKISNSLIDARLYLPDPERGYYRGTRFDWSGIIASLRYCGHEYFGEWFECHDPKKHDAVVGPAEEFEVEGGGLGYCEAQPSDPFIRIGVGVLRKPDEAAYRKFGTYEIMDFGRWATRQGKSWIEFQHEVENVGGYAYLYRKTVSLTESRPELLLQHTLKNTGLRSISTVTYNHNFFFIDGEPSSPDINIRLPFAIRASGDLKDLAKTCAGRLEYLRELQKGESIYTQLDGFSDAIDDHRVLIENRETGAGVTMAGDRPLAQLNFWSVRRAVCPEPYISLNIASGEEVSWKTRYSFYTLPISTGGRGSRTK